MKNIFFLLLVIFGTTFVSYGQKYGYIDSEYILEQMPEYQEAKKELDKYAKRWQKEIEDMYAQIKQRQQEYNRVEVILPELEREKRKKEIDELIAEAREMQQMRFGVDGDLFAKRRELIEPIQDKIFDALKKVASNRNFAFIFDKANQSNLIFADPKYDISDMVLRELGIHKR